MHFLGGLLVLEGFMFMRARAEASLGPEAFAIGVLMALIFAGVCCYASLQSDRYFQKAGYIIGSGLLFWQLWRHWQYFETVSETPLLGDAIVLVAYVGLLFSVALMPWVAYGLPSWLRRSPW